MDRGAGRQARPFSFATIQKSPIITQEEQRLRAEAKGRRFSMKSQAWFAFVVAMALQSAARAEDPPPTPLGTDDPVYLVVTATSPGGTPVVGATFDLIQDGERLSQMTTGPNGSTRFMVPKVTDWSKAEVVINSPDWGALPPTRRMNRTGSTVYQLYKLYPTDPAKVAPSDRGAYLRMMGEIYAVRRTAAPAFQPSNAAPNSLQLSAFLFGSRTEAPVQMNPDRPAAESADSQAPTLTITSTIVDETGIPLGFRRALLFTMKEATNEVIVADSRNSDRLGRVEFPGLAPDRLYRIEVPPLNDNRLGRSGIFHGGAGPAKSVPPIVVRPVTTQVSGILVIGDEPVRGAEVLTADGVRITTRTDEFGWFELAPVSDGVTVDVVIRMPGRRASGVYPLMPGREEYILPAEMALP
jgi:hypothetical protein